MLYLEDLHVHTTMCDGKNTPEEMVQTAIARGLTTLGFSVHTTTPYTPYHFAPIEDYFREIRRLQEVYRSQIRILCGVEQDCFCPDSTEGFDYVIGSVHRVLIDGEDVSVDVSPKVLTDAAKKYFGGDIIPLAAEYYRLLGQIVETTGADIIGHFDLITKFNEGGRLFDENDPRYRAAAIDAADALLATGKPFEINTGAISRGWRTYPFPSRSIQDYLAARGAKFVLSSDSHSVDTVAYQFDHWRQEALSRNISLIPFSPRRG